MINRQAQDGTVLQDGLLHPAKGADSVPLDVQLDKPYLRNGPVQPFQVCVKLDHRSLAIARTQQRCLVVCFSECHELAFLISQSGALYNELGQSYLVAWHVQLIARSAADARVK